MESHDPDDSHHNDALLDNSSKSELENYSINQSKQPLNEKDTEEILTHQQKKDGFRIDPKTNNDQDLSLKLVKQKTPSKEIKELHKKEFIQTVLEFLTAKEVSKMQRVCKNWYESKVPMSLSSISIKNDQPLMVKIKYTKKEEKDKEKTNHWFGINLKSTTYFFAHPYSTPLKIGNNAIVKNDKELRNYKGKMYIITKFNDSQDIKFIFNKTREYINKEFKLPLQYDKEYTISNTCKTPISYYDGEVQDAKRHGEGKYYRNYFTQDKTILSNGTNHTNIYIGQFQYDEREGEGFSFSDSRKSIGQWKHNRMSGLGVTLFNAKDGQEERIEVPGMYDNGQIMDKTSIETVNKNLQHFKLERFINKL